MNSRKAELMALAKIKRAIALELNHIAPTMAAQADWQRLRDRANVHLKEAIELEAEFVGVTDKPK
jgi:hypothetical protein